MDTGDTSYNVNVVAEIWDELSGTYGGSIVMSSISGTQTGSDLLFDFGEQILSPGDYWITAYVVRPFSGGGQWFWGSDDVVNGSEAYFWDRDSLIGGYH